MPKPLDPTEDRTWRGFRVFFGFLAKVGYRPEVTGADVFESIGPEEGVVVAANHQSLCDAYLMDQKHRPLRLRPLQENIVLPILSLIRCRKKTG